MFKVGILWLVLAVVLVGCGSEEDVMELGVEEGTRTVIVDDVPYTVPNYAFLNEVFPITRMVGGQEEWGRYVFRHFSESPSHEECCTTRFFFKPIWLEVFIPTYPEVLYLGPPLTLPDNQTHTIALETNNDFLISASDQIDEIKWQQIRGSSNFDVASDGRSLTFNTPALEGIERWVFEVEITTAKGRVFTKEKAVFVVPRRDWLDVTQIYAGADYNTSIVLREDNTFYLEAYGVTSFSEPLDRPVKLLANLGDSAFVVTDDNRLSVHRLGRVTPVENDFGNVTELLGVYSVRNTLLVVNDEGEAFSSLGGYNVRVNDAISVAPSLDAPGPYLNTNQVLVDQEGAVIAENVKQLSATAYLSESGKVGVIRPHEKLDLSVFEQYHDYISVAGSKNEVSSSGLNQYVFALRPNGEVVGTTRLPPSLKKITDVSTGGGTHLALSESGWVYLWGESFNDSPTAVSQGFAPNPMNLTQEAYERFKTLGE